MISKPARLAKPTMAARWRLSLSLSAPTLVALEGTQISDGLNELFFAYHGLL